MLVRNRENIKRDTAKNCEDASYSGDALDEATAPSRIEEMRSQLGSVEDEDTRNRLELAIDEMEVEQEAMGSVIKDEFDQVYTRQGGSGMNAFTSNDVTFYFITVPSNKFELWAWMESDRLNDSVFREFWSERDVVHESVVDG